MSENGRKVFNIVIAILVSIAAWTYVVYNNDPNTEVTYKDIPIVFEGETALANMGLGISQVSDGDEKIDVVLRQPRVRTNDISADNIRVVADVSSAVEGENGISLIISGPENTQVIDASKRSISVDVEESDSVERDIIVEYANTGLGNEPVVSKMTSTVATVIGAASEIERVDKVAALLTLEETGEMPKNITASLTAIDSDGDPIKHMVIYPSEVNFNAYTGMTKEVPLMVDVEKPDDDYNRTWSAPSTIVIKGSAEAISDVDRIYTTKIDLGLITENTEFELEYDMPEGVYLANGQEGKMVRIRVAKKKAEELEDEETDTASN